MSATKEWFMNSEERLGFQLVGDYPNSGHEEPTPDEQPKDYVVIDDQTDDLPF